MSITMYYWFVFLSFFFLWREICPQDMMCLFPIINTFTDTDIHSELWWFYFWTNTSYIPLDMVRPIFRLVCPPQIIGG